MLQRLLPVAAALLCLATSAAALEALSDDDLRNIPSATDDDFDIHTGKILAPILIPRVPGTEGSYKVQQHFADWFSNHLPEWELILENSTSKTPATGDKDVPFTNLIFRRDPPGAAAGDISRLTLVAHYDSKYTPTGFIGAIDSAAPCAMLMHVAQSIEDAFQAKWGGADEVLGTVDGVQIVFLDGEEAFVSWTNEDSLYGARSLASEWESSKHPSMSTYHSALDSISLFVLLDLLGSADMTVPSYFLTTHWAYQNLAALEKRMRHLGDLESKPRQAFLPNTDKESQYFGRGFIADDHVPFMKRGVDVLHLIPTPFPPVWHEMEDDGEHLDMPTVKDWAKLMTAFVVEWLDLREHMPRRAVTRDKRSETEGAVSKRTEL